MRGIYIVGSYPDRETFKKCLKKIDECGYEFVEAGIPFNEPVADGPVISAAIQKSLDNGAKTDDILEDIKECDLKTTAVYIMTYSNIIYANGIENFNAKFKDVIKGIIIPDVPNRMHNFFYDKGFEIPIIPFVTPESRDEDIEEAANLKGDFIYFIGMRGITGGKADFSSPELAERVGKLKSMTDKKIVLGFGIKDREGADAAMKVAGGFVVGTEAVKRQEDFEEFSIFMESLV